MAIGSNRFIIGVIAILFFAGIGVFFFQQNRTNTTAEGDEVPAHEIQIEQEVQEPGQNILRNSAKLLAEGVAEPFASAISQEAHEAYEKEKKFLQHPTSLVLLRNYEDIFYMVYGDANAYRIGIYPSIDVDTIEYAGSIRSSTDQTERYVWENPEPNFLAKLVDNSGDLPEFALFRDKDFLYHFRDGSMWIVDGLDAATLTKRGYERIPLYLYTDKHGVYMEKNDDLFRIPEADPSSFAKWKDELHSSNIFVDDDSVFFFNMETREIKFMKTLDRESLALDRKFEVLVLDEDDVYYPHTEEGLKKMEGVNPQSVELIIPGEEEGSFLFLRDNTHVWKVFEADGNWSFEIINGARPLSFDFLHYSLTGEVQNRTLPRAESISFPESYAVKPIDLPEGFDYLGIDSQARKMGILTNPGYIYNVDSWRNYISREDILNVQSLFIAVYAFEGDWHASLTSIAIEFQSESEVQKMLSRMPPPEFDLDAAHFANENVLIGIWHETSMSPLEFQEVLDNVQARTGFLRIR